MFEGYGTPSEQTAQPSGQGVGRGTLSPFDVQQQAIGRAPGPSQLPAQWPPASPTATPHMQTPQNQPVTTPGFYNPQTIPTPAVGFPSQGPQSLPGQMPVSGFSPPVSQGIQNPGLQAMQAPSWTIGQTATPAQTPQTHAPGVVGSQIPSPTFGLSSGPQASPTGPTTRQPPMDIRDAGDEFEIEIELPGVTKEDIQLVGQEHGLSLRAFGEERSTEDLVASERGQQVFQRDIPLGFEVDPKKVSAKFINGILTVSVPNKAAKGRGAIEIK